MARKKTPGAAVAATPAAGRGSRWTAPLLVCGLGIAFLAAGVLLLGPASDHALSEAQTLQAAPVVDAHSAGTVPLGTRVLLHGRLAPPAALPRHGLVVYERQQYEGTETSGARKGRARWRALERATPAFDLHVPGGAVSIASGEYALEAPPREVAPDGGPVGGAVRIDLRVIDLSTERLIGFAAGDPATIDGLIEARPGGGRAVRAALVFGGGDAAAYRAARSAGARTVFTLGIVFSAVGASCLALGALLLCRLRGRSGVPADQGNTP